MAIPILVVIYLFCCHSRSHTLFLSLYCGALCWHDILVCLHFFTLVGNQPNENAPLQTKYNMDWDEQVFVFCLFLCPTFRHLPLHDFLVVLVGSFLLVKRFCFVYSLSLGGVTPRVRRCRCLVGGAVLNSLFTAAQQKHQNFHSQWPKWWWWCSVVVALLFFQACQYRLWAFLLLSAARYKSHTKLVGDRKYSTEILLILLFLKKKIL